MKRKLAGFGLAFSVAELAAAYLPPLASVLTAAVFLFLIPVFLAERSGPRRPFLPVIAGVAAGLLWSELFCWMVVRPAQALAGKTVRCTAVIQTDCSSSWQQGSLRGTLLLTEVDGKKTSLRVSCTAFPYGEPGEKFTAQFLLDSLPADRYRMSRYSDGIWLSAEYVEGWQPAGTVRSLRLWLYQLRRELSQRLSLYLPRDLAGLESAMLLGDSSRLDDALSNTFRTAGISHLLAVSGLHVALLCGLLSFGRKRTFSRILLALQAVALIFYMGLTGFPVSVLRAGIVFLIALAGYAMLRPPDALTSLGAAAVLIGLQPFAPCDIGFQLSFCGVLGVQAAGGLARRERQCFLRRLETDELSKILSMLLGLLETVQAACFASLATFPVLLAHDMTTSGVAVLSNFLVVWMLGPALHMGLLALLFSALPVFDPVYHGVSFALGVWLKGMVSLAGFCANLPAARLCLPRKYTLFVLGLLAALALVFYCAGKMLHYIPTAAVCVTAAILLGNWMQKDVIQIAMLGTAGNACTVITQNSRAAVLFRGGTPNRRAVSEYLACHGAPTVETLIDLRTDSKQETLDAETLIPMEELPEGVTQIALLDTITADLYHDDGGNLAVLDAGGYHVAAAAGEVSLSEPVSADLFLAAGGYPQAVNARVILTNQENPRWRKAVGDERIYLGTDTPMVTLRPGRSVVFEEVRKIAVQ